MSWQTARKILRGKIRSANVIVLAIFLIGLAITTRAYPLADLSSISSSLMIIVVMLMVWGVMDYLSESEEKKKEVKKQFSCIHCGSKFDVFTPDDVHTIASRIENDSSIKVDFKCKSCGNINTIYWEKKVKGKQSK